MAAIPKWGTPEYELACQSYDYTQLEPYKDVIGFRDRFIELYGWNEGIPQGTLAKVPKGKWRNKSRSHEEAAQLIRNGQNVGVVPGEGFVIVDFDLKKCAAQTDKNGKVIEPAIEPDELLAEFYAHFGVDPSDYFTVRSGGGGFHLYGRVPMGLKFLGKVPGFRGAFDVKSSNGYVVCPGSVHRFGTKYEVMAEHPSLSDTGTFPIALIEAITKPERKPGDHAEWGIHSPDQIADMLSYLDPCDFREYEAPHGERCWLYMAMACHHASDGWALTEFQQWSARDPRYGERFEQIERHWESFEIGSSSVTAAYIYKWLEEAGLGHCIPHPCIEMQLAGEDISDWLDGTEYDETAEQDMFSVCTATEFAETVREAEPLLDGFFWARGTYVFAGPPGLGKTAVALDLMLAVASGDDTWKGRQLWASGPALFIAAEGEIALGSRLQAWTKHHGRALPEDLHILSRGAASVDLGDPKAQREILKIAKRIKPVVTVIDTLFAAWPGAKINDADAATKAMAFLRELEAAAGGATIAVHHPPKSDASEVYGSQVFKGSVDGVVLLQRPKGGKAQGFVMRGEKVRLGKPEPDIPMELQTVDLGPDEHRPGRRREGPVVTARSVDPTQNILEATCEVMMALDIEMIKQSKLVTELEARLDLSPSQIKRNLGKAFPAFDEWVACGWAMEMRRFQHGSGFAIEIRETEIETD